MKRIAAGLLALSLMGSCVACGNLQTGQSNLQSNSQNSQDTQSDQNGLETNTQDVEPSTSDVDVIIISSACDILQKAWDTYEDTDSDDNMYNDKFAVMGGHQEAYVLDMPGAYDLSKAQDLERSFCMPEAMLAYIDDAATMMHLMHANTFSAAAFHIADDDRVQEVIEALENRILDNQWLGGSPDKFVIVTVADSYVVVAFGQEECIDYFKAALLQVYENTAEVSVETMIR